MKVNKEWNEKYLSGIFSIYDRSLVSPIKNIPRPYNATFWKKLNVAFLIGGALISFFFAALNHMFENWILDWVSNLFLNLSLGMLASLIILMYTDRKQENISFYEQNLDLLKNQAKKMDEAFYESFGKIPYHTSFNDFEKATNSAFNAFECFFAIINFFELLYDNFDRIPRPFNCVTKEKLKEAKEKELELCKKIENAISDNVFLDRDNLFLVERSGDFIHGMLAKLKIWISDTEKNLYEIKFGSSAGGETK